VESSSGPRLILFVRAGSVCGTPRPITADVSTNQQGLRREYQCHLRDETWDGDRLPQAYVDILADMAGALHDTITAPDIAANFESTPEQLLETARRL